MINRLVKILSVSLVGGAVLAGCSSRSDMQESALNVGFSTGDVAQATPIIETVETRDPIEGVNRAIFAFNDTLDTFILRPISWTYREVIPEGGRNMVRSFVRNLSTPVVLLNDILQGDADRARITFSRFLVNTTVGVGGLFDVTDGLDLPYHSEDFGQTIAVWNKSEATGPYIVLPLLGPSNLRDTTGLVVDTLTNPLTWMGGNTVSNVRVGSRAAGVIDGRSRLIDSSDNLKASTDDYYAAIRTLYEQNRDYEIRNGSPNLNLPAPGDDE